MTNRLRPCIQCVSMFYDSSMKKCRLFGRVDEKGRKIIYDLCNEARNNQLKCGTRGTYFLQNSKNLTYDLTTKGVKEN